MTAELLSEVLLQNQVVLHSYLVTYLFHFSMCVAKAHVQSSLYSSECSGWGICAKPDLDVCKQSRM